MSPGGGGAYFHPNFGSPENGVPSTGGGGGGMYRNPITLPVLGGNGGSGLVVVIVPPAAPAIVSCTNGTVFTQPDGARLVRFLQSGTLTF